MPGSPEKNDDRLKVELRNARGIHKGSVTKLEKWIEASDISKDEHDVDAKLEMLDTFFRQFCAVQDQLEALDSKETAEREEMEKRVFTAKATLKRLRFKLTTGRSGSTSFHDATNATIPVSVEVCNPMDVPVPKLPKFNGEDYLDYPNFINAFKALVDSRTTQGFSDIKKFSILRNSLEGRAAESVKHLLLTAENYKAALTILDNRFLKTRLIFDSLVKKLLNLPKATGASSLRKMLDAITVNLQALTTLPATNEQIGFGILIHHVLKQVDDVTLNKWEEQSCQEPDELPSWKDLLSFLERRANILEAVSYLQHDKKPKDKPSSKKAYTAMQTSCGACSGNCSSISSCATFLKKAPKDRYTWVKSNQYCVRCLERSPHTEKCAPERCTNCRGRHHTLLHFGEVKPAEKLSPEVTACQEVKSSLNVTRKPFNDKMQILGTALIQVQARKGDWIPARALIDSGSMTHFVTKRLAAKLHLKLSKASAPVIGLFGGLEIRESCNVNFRSTTSGYTDKLEALILPEFSHLHPSSRLDSEKLKIPKNLPLADPTFDTPQRVDAIIGVGLAYKLMMIGQIQLSDAVIMQKTQLGWILAGEVSASQKSSTSKFSLLTGIDVHERDDNLEKLLRRFWELDIIPSPSQKWSTSEQFCEDHFVTNTTRDAAGKFIVRLPLYKDPESLGDSHAQARSRLAAMERKLEKDTELSHMYKEFLREYEELGHMSKVSEPNLKSINYLPHHGVLKLDSTSTKCRVVFDASAPTSTGVALNDLMPHGPTIQPLLFTILLRFRFHKVALCGDISKMYRQIWVHPDDRHHQCILWRREGDNHLTTFALNTVTYGTSSAPFLAIRAVNELAMKSTTHPAASSALLNDTYVDNTLTGARTPVGALSIYNQANELLATGGFEMRKWYSNSTEVMDAIPHDRHDKLMNIGDDDIIKTLGLRWNPDPDHFVFMIERAADSTKWTKRKLMSHIAKIFDPLGFLEPVVVKLKIFMQLLWSKGLNWDESLPQDLHTVWLRVLRSLPLLEDFRVPRYVFYDEDKVTDVQLHCYADASAQAYGTVFYVRCTLEGGQIVVRNLCSKSKVAPVKKISLPRLELCGAGLLAELLTAVWPTLVNRVSRVECRLDAQVALTWVTHSPHRYSDFIASRVTKIQEATVGCTWLHIPGVINPADILSRGASPTTFLQYKPWLTGPEYLYRPESQWTVDEPDEVDEGDDRLEMRQVTFTYYAHVESDLLRDYKYHGSLIRVQKTFAYIAKMINAMKRTDTVSDGQQLRSEDLERGLQLAVRIVQAQNFYAEYHALKMNHAISKRSPLLKLSPFMDDKGLIRVGGRLSYAPDLTFDERHPLLLPKNHPFTNTVFFHHHWKHLHAGPQTLLAIIRRKFWPIGGRAIANRIYRNCMVCARQAKRVFQQVMGDLPVERVQPFLRCFENVGVDLCGPFWLKASGRGSQKQKAYIMVLICFSTRAVQLQPVYGEDTNSVLNSLIRFICRVGRPQQIWSDNATNFKGVSNVFKSVDWGQIDEWCRNEHRINWRFIPARTPHFGGLWEASVKLAKKHLTKVVKNVTLHHDSFVTLLAMVEAVLNSRPITPLAVNPADGQPLTPAHFLVGAPLIALPDPVIQDLPRNQRSLVRSWQHLSEIKRHWLQRWQTEVRQHLQSREKWHSGSLNIRRDKLVMMVDRDKAPHAWMTARISKLLPGRDGRVRTVEVTTVAPDGTKRLYNRGISELVPLPMDDDGDKNPAT